MEISKIKEIIKNPNFIGTVVAIVVFAAIAWIYFTPDVMQGKVLRQHDVMQGISVGQEVAAYKAETGETSRWTNSLFGGMPNFQIRPEYESSSLINWIKDAYSLWLPANVNLLFIMMLGFYIMLMAFGVKWYIALLGSIGWSFSTYFFIIIGAGHIWKYITLAYIPPTIAGIVWAYRGKYLAGGAVAALFATLQLSANHIQMSYYFLFLIAGLAIAYLVNAVKEKKVKQWGIATGVLVVAAVLAVAANSPNLYNTYKYSKETMRGGHSELATPDISGNATAGGLNRDYITQWSYGIDETLSLIVPNVNGGASIKPVAGQNMPMMLSTTKEAKDLINSGAIGQQEAGILAQSYQYFGDQPMTNGPVYVGVLIFALFLLGCMIVKGAVKWAVVAVTILTVFLSWGHNFPALTNFFIDYFPLYNKFRTVASILVVAELTMPLMAVLALDKLFAAENPFKTYKTQLFISFGITALLCFVLMWAPNLFIGDAFSAQEVEYYGATGYFAQYPSLFEAIAKVRYMMVENDALRSLIILIVGFAVLMLFMMDKINEKLAVGLIAVVVLADMFTVNKRYLNSESFQEAEKTPAIVTPRPVDTQILQDTAMNYRVFDYSKFGEAMPSYFHKTIGGYHAAKLSRYQDIIDNCITSDKGTNIKVINMLNTKYFIMDDNHAEQNPYALGNAWFVDGIDFVATPREEIDALDDIEVEHHAVSDKKFESVLGGEIPAIAEGDTIYETTYAPNRLTYKSVSANGGVAVFSEIYFPWGWEAKIDGTPVEIGRVNYILRAVKVPAGTYDIEFTFYPKSVTVTETMAYIAMIIIYAAFAVLIFVTLVGKKRKE